MPDYMSSIIVKKMYRTTGIQIYVYTYSNWAK